MGLSGKRVAQFEIKSDGDVFHEVFRYKPHHVSNMSPSTIQGCQLHEGEIGTVGSIVFWNYFHDGKDRVGKTLIQDINEENKTIIFKFVEGDLLELYKTFVVTCHVDTKGENNLVTWTVEYEKLKEDVPDPDTLMEFYEKLTKDIETHHLQQ